MTGSQNNSVCNGKNEECFFTFVLFDLTITNWHPAVLAYATAKLIDFYRYTLLIPLPMLVTWFIMLSWDSLVFILMLISNET